MAADPKLGRAAALRNAMLAYMNDKGRSLNAYPAFWGPFPPSERERRDEGARQRPHRTVVPTRMITKQPWIKG
jgi:hypothetical protein